MRVTIRAPLFPTESEEKVVKALKKLFPHVEFHVEGEGRFREIVGTCECATCLENLRLLLRRQRILDSARSYIYRGREAGIVRFYLNKQAAYVGKVSFCSYEFGESPLGAIVVVVEVGERFEEFVNWLAPATINGKPVNEVSEIEC